MVKFSVCLLLGGLSALTSALPAAAPAPTAAPDLDKRATTCTFSGSGGASSASKSKTSCSTIILSALAVPSGTTLDLTGLTKGTTVSFVQRSWSLDSTDWLINRSSLKVSPPSAMKNGLVLWSLFREQTSLLLKHLVLTSMAAELLTGMEKVPTEERRSPNSFTRTA